MLLCEQILIYLRITSIAVVPFFSRRHKDPSRGHIPRLEDHHRIAFSAARVGVPKIRLHLRWLLGRWEWNNGLAIPPHWNSSRPRNCCHTIPHENVLPRAWSTARIFAMLALQRHHPRDPRSTSLGRRRVFPINPTAWFVEERFESLGRFDMQCAVVA